MAIKSKGRGYIAQEREKPEEKAEAKKIGRPITRTAKHSKRTINFDDDLWNELAVIAFIKDGWSGSVTKELHKAAREYINNVEIPDDVDYESLRKVVLKSIAK